MIVDFIAMLSAAALAVLVVFAFRHGLRKWGGVVLPKWVMPAMAGLAMLGYTIHAEYRWYPDLKAGLNGDMSVVMTVEDRNWWRPWTYAAPVTTRFMAVDLAQVTDPAPGVRAGKLLLVSRWQPMQQVPVAYDCAGHRRADLIGGAHLQDGTLTGGEWLTVSPQDPALAALCGSARHG
ncbi:hypothetical protein [Thioclava sp. GXIMD4216]|uniref:Uncharacterized protein n=1 Tax=Thioclava litoralis TaxID=3076557 RepID=A0ABZ1DYT3_9RHOB|nr:hypothetical protein RPE78_01345 [Thioclava sp. FTW29]